MKVGDYVRYKYENCIYIGKIKFISEVMSGLDETLQLDIDNCMEEILKEDIIKSSPNIIDLIEVGDIIKKTYKTGLIEKIPINKIEDIEHIKLDLKNGFKLTIVTNEQFLQMEYKIGE